MDIDVTGQDSVDWIYLAEDAENQRAVVNTVMNRKAVNFLAS